MPTAPAARDISSPLPPQDIALGSVLSPVRPGFFKTGSRWRLLIVDDHASTREMIRTVLEAYADLIEVVGEASDGQEALTQLALSPVDLVLMNVNLPNQNGVDATRRMKQLLPHIVILGMSTEYSPHDYGAMIAAGTIAFVRKEDAANILFKTIIHSMFTYCPYRENAKAFEERT